MPSFLRGNELSDEVRREIDKLNAQLASQLAQEDSLFSEGRTTDGDVCVLVGVVCLHAYSHVPLGRRTVNNQAWNYRRQKT
jgi:hypothetical protein